jgi:hypothetical protein
MQTVTLGASQLGVEVVEVQPNAYPTNSLTGSQTPPAPKWPSPTARSATSPTPVHVLDIDVRGQGRPESARCRGGNRQARRSSQGQHAVRTVVGAPFGSDQANEDVTPVQSQVVEALGLSHLEKVA